MGWSEDKCVFRSYVSLTGPKRWHSCETHVRTFLFDEHIQWTTSIDNTKHRLTVWDQRRGPTRWQGQWGDFLWGQGGKTFFLKSLKSQITFSLHSWYEISALSALCFMIFCRTETMGEVCRNSLAFGKIHSWELDWCHVCVKSEATAI